MLLDYMHMCFGSHAAYVLSDDCRNSAADWSHKRVGASRPLVAILTMSVWRNVLTACVVTCVSLPSDVSLPLGPAAQALGAVCWPGAPT